MVDDAIARTDSPGLGGTSFEMDPEDVPAEVLEAERLAAEVGTNFGFSSSIDLLV